VSVFEYLSVMHSIILALGVARLLGGVADLSRHWGTIGAEWLLAIWLFQLLMQHTGWWFGLWHAFHDSVELPLWMFVLSLSIPASLYVASRLLVPNLDSETPIDFADWFGKIRVPFYISVAVTTIPYSSVRLLFFEGTSNQGFIVLIGAIALFGLFIRNIRGHYVIGMVTVAIYSSFLILARAGIGGGV
jgi:hypothetical protein